MTRMSVTPGRILAAIGVLVLCLLFIQTGVLIGEQGGLPHFFVQECNERYPLLNPVRRCNAEATVKREYEDVEDRLEAWVTQKRREGTITHLSLYYRDLENGPWFGVEEDEEFSAASLLKVPILIAYLKQAEGHPSLLTDTLSYSEPFDEEQNVSDAEAVLPGFSYPAEDVLRRMIVYSDNFAKELIKHRLRQLSPQSDIVASTYHDLGLFPESADLDQFLTVKAYASVFRALYNASYLSREMSQRALGLLTQTTFQDGIAAGLPPDVILAHKFGVRENPDGSGQLHDCGIVYQPDNPYLLCIMTRGGNMRTNAWAIGEVTRIVHGEVVERMKQRVE